MRTQGDYVTRTAKGDATIIHSAGFESIEETIMARATVQEDPEAPVCTPLSGGGLKVNIKGTSKVSNYCFILVVDGVLNATIQNVQMFTPTVSNIYLITSTKHIVTFPGLPR